MPTEVNGDGVAFDEAIAYHRDKLALPSKTWTDIWGREHARAFIVAGAATDELVGGFYEAIGQAIVEGRTLADFRKDFDRLVERHGWSYNGARGWRSAVIYNTNMSQAYNAGRWEQGKSLPGAIGRYRHNPSAHERPEHVAWDGTRLPLSHAWWTTHWPINAWGCHCQVDILSGKAAEAAGWTVSDEPPPDPLVTRTVNTASGPMTVTVPRGIDPGFDYNPGEAAFGHQLTEQVMAEWRAKGAAAWEVTNPGDWQSAKRPETVPLDAPKVRLGPPVKDRAGLRAAIESAIGGKETVLAAPDGARVLIDAAALADHLDLGRAPFVPLLRDAIENPFEVWLAFERHQGTGRVELRKRFVKSVNIGKGRSLIAVAQANRGRLEAWTFIPSTRAKGLYARSRVGKLLYGREE